MGFWDILKPYKIYTLDADTGQPLDPNVRLRTDVTYYDVKKKKDPSSRHGSGSKLLVAHKATREAMEEKLSEGKKSGKGKEDGKSDTKSGKEKVKEDGGEKKDEAKKKGGGESKGADEVWTAEEDAKLRAGKEANTSWKALAAEIGRPQGQCKQRWKEIQGQPVGRAAAGADDGGKKEEKGKGKEKKAKEEQQGSGEGKKAKKDRPAKASDDHAKYAHHHHHHAQSNKHAHHHRPDPASKPRSHTRDRPVSEARFTLAEWRTVQEDDTFSFGELQALSELIAKDESQSWQRVASRFFDLTGRRVHWEDIRDKFMGLGAMGQ